MLLCTFSAKNLSRLSDKRLRMCVSVAEAPKGRSCLVCGSPLGILRRMSRKRFCCDEHQEQYLDELKQIAVERLQTARQRLDSTRSRRVTA